MVILTYYVDDLQSYKYLSYHYVHIVYFVHKWTDFKLYFKSNKEIIFGFIATAKFTVRKIYINPYYKTIKIPW